MKKWICWILCAALLLGALPLAAGAENTPWYEGYARYAGENGLMKGRAADDFAGEGTLTRAEFATVLYRLAGEPPVSEEESPFADAPDGKWYSSPVVWAYHAKVVTGYPDGTFRPQEPITREAIAAMTVRWLTYEKVYLTAVADPVTGQTQTAFSAEEYTDRESISSWAAEAVGEVSRLGLMTGSEGAGGRVFRPSAPVTRGECAAVAARLHSGVLAARENDSATRLLSQAEDEAALSPWELLEKYPLSQKTLAAVDRFTGETAASLLRGTETNGCYSPLSLYTALAVLTSGAAGETRQELLDALGQQEETLAGELETLYRWNNQERNGVTEKLANSLWLDATGRVSFRPEWIRQASRDYHADVFQADFLSGEAGELLGQWIEDHTGGLLHPSQEEMGFTEDTVMAIVNTLYYKAAWVENFAPASVWQETFTPEKGAKKEADFLHRTARDTRCLVTEDCTVGELPLIGGRMRFFLPQEGKTVDGLLEADRLQELLTASLTQDADVVWSVPKFEAEETYDLVGTLQQLGIHSAFNELTADFSKISEHQLVVGNVRQGTHLSLTEDGVEAAAYTVIDVEAKSAMPRELPQVLMKLDRPFAYVIYGQDGAPLFVGTVRQP